MYEELYPMFTSGIANRQTIISFPNGEHPDITEKIYSGSMQLKKVLNSSGDLNFGEVNATCFEAQVGVDVDFSGYEIRVYQIIDNNYIIDLFRGIVDSSEKLSYINSYRQIIAYDKVYSLSNIDVTDWYNNYFEENSSVTIKKFRDDFFSYLSIIQEDTTLVNDPVNFWKVEVDSIDALSLIQQICKFNACFGTITAKGTFKYVYISTTPSYDLSGNYKKSTAIISEYSTAQITAVSLTELGTEEKIVTGSGYNYLYIDDSIFTYSHTYIQLVTAAQLILAKVNPIQYRPISLELIYSLPYLELGDCYTFQGDDGTTYRSIITSITLYGSQLMSQVIQSSGNKDRVSESQKFSLSSFKIQSEIDRKLSSVQQTNYDFNKVISHALGLFDTQVEQPNGSIIRYLHNKETLEESNIIFTLNENGFAWTESGWNDGNPVWSYGTTSAGFALFKMLSAEGINVEKTGTDYHIEITPEKFSIYYKDMPVTTIDRVEMSIPQVKVTTYIDIGKLRFVPYVVDGEVVGTNALFLD